MHLRTPFGVIVRVGDDASGALPREGKRYGVREDADVSNGRFTALCRHGLRLAIPSRLLGSPPEIAQSGDHSARICRTLEARKREADGRRCQLIDAIPNESGSG